MKQIVCLLLIVFSVKALCDDDFHWLTENGEIAPERENQKSNAGFGGWLLVTPDKDWEEKWNTPRENTPHFAAADDVKIGEELTILPFFANPMLDNSGRFEILCDIRVENPEGAFSIDEKNVPCANGYLNMDPKSIFLTQTVIKFIGEEGDAFGMWSVYFDMHDSIRGVTVSLKTSFNLVE